VIPRLLLTPGEPAGIGPDLVVQLAQRDFDAELTAIADPELLRARAELLGLPLTIEIGDFGSSVKAHRPGRLKVLPVTLPVRAIPGRLDVRNAPYVLDTLRLAARACLDGKAQALVTAPVQKSVINDAGIVFSGHTEFLAGLCGAPTPVMLLVAANKMRVALATTHLPLREVPKAITREGLLRVLRVLHADLREKFGIDAPRILVAGLNPHAGESGHLGHEELEVLAPVIAQLAGEGMHLSGPLPADTLFTPKYLAQADAVLAMYHDQGLPVLKYASFGEAVNVTLGLPFIRTSVDHGTALDLAGSGRAESGSLAAAITLAIELAIRLAHRRHSA
jgi:4-hydroxythreonine-4-phosphate dehydrogenase